MTVTQASRACRAAVGAMRAALERARVREEAAELCSARASLWSLHALDPRRNVPADVGQDHHSSQEVRDLACSAYLAANSRDAWSGLPGVVEGWAEAHAMLLTDWEPAP